jgi:hypothetical protein
MVSIISSLVNQPRAWSFISFSRIITFQYMYIVLWWVPVSFERTYAREKACENGGLHFKLHSVVIIPLRCYLIFL